MIPGRDGYGSGIKLKLFNHRPFNLTILYTNVSKVRNTNNNHDANLNRLIVAKDGENLNNEYELHPQVKETCANACGFIYVVDNKHLASLEAAMVAETSVWAMPQPGNIHNLSPIDNYKLELNVLMKEVSADLPLLILGCNADMKQASDTTNMSCMKLTTGEGFGDGDGLSCVQIIEKLELFNLNQEWQIRNCNLFQHKLKEIVLGFEWILNKLDQKILLEQFKAINSGDDDKD
jgi:hypothetical protein